MMEDENAPPKTKTLPDRGSGGVPPRPTAIGAADSDSDDLHVGQTVGCVVIGVLSDGYIVELMKAKNIRLKGGWNLWIHAVLVSSRTLRVGERTLAKVVKIDWNQIHLDDSVLGVVETPKVPIDPTLPTSGAAGIRSNSEPTLSSGKTDSLSPAGPKSTEGRPVLHLELPSPTIASEISESHDSVGFESEFDSIERSPLNWLTTLASKETKPATESYDDWISQIGSLEKALVTGIIIVESKDLGSTVLLIYMGGFHLIAHNSKCIAWPHLKTAITDWYKSLQGVPCELTFVPLPRTLVRSMFAILNEAPISNDRQFSNLTSLTNYFLTTAAWNGDDRMLYLYSADDGLMLMVGSSGIEIWDISSNTFSNVLEDVSNYIVRHPKAKVIMYEQAKLTPNISVSLARIISIAHGTIPQCNAFDE